MPVAFRGVTAVAVVLVAAGCDPILLIVPVLALSQAAQDIRTLIVNGQSGQVSVVQISGRSYVDLEALARVANGSLGFNGKPGHADTAGRREPVRLSSFFNKPTCGYRIVQRLPEGGH